MTYVISVVQIDKAYKKGRCKKCGDYTPFIDEATGWCIACLY
jgi:hypothetical protein